MVAITLAEIYVGCAATAYVARPITLTLPLVFLAGTTILTWCILFLRVALTTWRLVLTSFSAVVGMAAFVQVFSESYSVTDLTSSIAVTLLYSAWLCFDSVLILERTESTWIAAVTLYSDPIVLCMNALEAAAVLTARKRSASSEPVYEPVRDADHL